MFRVPGSSSPPSTPDRHRKVDSHFAGAHPSTTPAGPPPTSFTAASTTPAGPPPSSVFGSAQYNSAIPFSTAIQHVQSSPPRGAYDDADGDFDAMDEDDQPLSFRSSASPSAPRHTSTSNISAIAKSLSNPTQKLVESNLLILNTEDTIENLLGSIKTSEFDEDQIEQVLATSSQDLLQIWEGDADDVAANAGIGPGETSDPITKAVFLTSLLLPLHHPPRRRRLPSETSSLASSNTNRSVPTPIPEILLAWLRKYHNPFPEDLIEVLQYEPNPAAHERFWDVLYSATLRGNIKDTIDLLKEADFRYARTALDDGAEDLGYHGKQLGNAQKVVNQMIKILESCPAIQQGDWDVRGRQWSAFRKRVHQAVGDLENFAEGSSKDRDAVQESFQAENFGMSSMRDDGMSLSTASRRAESKVPWTLYQNLNYLYGQLLGTHAEILAASGDWVEASIGLTVWWNGAEEDEGQENLAASRRSHAQSRGNRLVDVRPNFAYRERLCMSLERVTAESEEPELQVNTMSSVEVGLACIFENSVEAVVGILRSFSSVISTGVVELGRLGEWLNDPSSGSADVMRGFDQSDLMVLSYAQQQPKGVSRDDVLIHFARLVSDKGLIEASNIRREGWEIAVEVMARLDNLHLAQDEIGKILDGLDLTSSEHVSKIVDLCTDMGLVEEARNIAERYADSVVQSSNKFGEALYYYSRAHNTQKVKDVLNVLVSFSLVQSTVYPPAAELDGRLRTMISTPTESISQLSLVDNQAAEILTNNLSGYATIRKFYDLRDEEVNLKESDKPAHRPIARMKEAAASLIAAITSASDSIHGGLYDSSTTSVLQVDGLLVLLGEALPFLGQERRILTLQQCFTILKAVEDLSTVSKRIFAQCIDCFKSALASANGTDPPSPQTLLKKSTSGLSASSQFSLLGSSMLEGSNESNEGSGILIKGNTKRGWDWRRGLKADMEGQDVLNILRLGIAKEVSRAWTDGE